MAASIFSAFQHSDFLGKAIFLLLFFLSIASWMTVIITIKNLYHWKKKSLQYEKHLLKVPEKIFAFSIEREPSYPFSSIYKELRIKSAEILEKNRFFSDDPDSIFLESADLPLLESQMQKAISQITAKIDRFNFILPTVIALAPILGLLGTVWGIFITFSHHGGSLAGNDLVLSGLSMALATTVVGLLVAIPAIIAHNFIKTEVRSFKNKMVQFASTLLYHLEMQYRKVHKEKV
jgi:biopolymer transport protein TolQ